MVPGGLKNFFQKHAGGGEDGGEGVKDCKELTSALFKPVESFFDQLSEGSIMGREGGGGNNF